MNTISNIAECIWAVRVHLLIIVALLWFAFWYSDRPVQEHEEDN